MNIFTAIDADSAGEYTDRMKRQLIAEQWDDYVLTVMPPDAPLVQKTECRRAFYAGAQSILFSVIKGLSSDAEPTEADMRLLQDVADELEQFAKLVKQGQA